MALNLAGGAAWQLGHPAHALGKVKEGPSARGDTTQKGLLLARSVQRPEVTAEKMHQLLMGHFGAVVGKPSERCC